MSQKPGPSNSQYSLRSRPKNRDSRYWRPRYTVSSSSSFDSDENENVYQADNVSVGPALLTQKTPPPSGNCNFPLSETEASGTLIQSSSITTRASATHSNSRILSNDFSFRYSESSSGNEIQPTQNRRKGRTRWSKQKNSDLLYAYYKSTDIETNKKHYLSRLQHIWKSEFSYDQLEGNKLSTQVRSVLSRNVFSKVEIEQIKSKVRQEQSTHESNNEEQFTFENTSVQANTSNLSVPDIPITNISPTTYEEVLSPNESIEDTQIKQQFNTYKATYELSNPREKPNIPQIPYNKKSQCVVTQVNESLKHEFEKSKSLQDTHHFIYCAALTVCFLLNISIKNYRNTSNVTRKNEEPPWKRR